MHETSVVLGLEDPALQEEILHFLERLPTVRVVGAAADGPGLAREIRESHPDAAVISPMVLRHASDVDGAAVFVVAARETTEALRSALKGGARGFYLWPEEREALARDTERAARPRKAEPGSRGRVLAVYGPRGGAGVTFLATNLAAACADRDASTVLVDLDPFYADVTAALGLPIDPATPTIADLAPVQDELTAEHLERVLYAHPRGFRVLLSPREPSPELLLQTPGVASAIRLLRSRFDVVVLHLPRGVDDATRIALDEADDILVVVSLDVLALRDARRALTFLAGLGMKGACRLVVNRAARGEVVPGDAEQVLGLQPISVIRSDRAVGRAQNRGELLAGRSGPAARGVAALARRLTEGT